MELLDIKSYYWMEGKISIKVKFNSGKTGFIKVKDGKIVDFALSDKVKKAVIDLLRRESYKYLKEKYNEAKTKRKEAEDDCIFTLYTEVMEEAKDLHSEIKKVYM